MSDRNQRRALQHYYEYGGLECKMPEISKQEFIVYLQRSLKGIDYPLLGSL